jgi:2-keto-4-pentenoate hydratase/2-oxohepta-3-ene-1,7-dioic acid hydratase in catechol pathway
MKIVKFDLAGEPRYGIWEDDRVFPCIGTPFEGLTRQGPPIPLSAARLLAPVSPANIICLGLNYRKHIEETKLPWPEKPLLFLKATTTVCGPGDPVVLPREEPDQIDYEVELAIVIGKKTRRIASGEVPGVVLGYTVANDVSNRSAQFKDGQWTRGKSYDTFCPLGPAIVTGIDPDNLGIRCRVDGKVMQDSSTSDLLFPIREIVSYVSECMTLLPGTIILTGTPGGVGYSRTPPAFLREGQVVECEIERIGILSNPVVKEM